MTSVEKELVRLMHDLAGVQVQLGELLDAHRRETQGAITVAQQIAADLRRAAEALAAQSGEGGGRGQQQGGESGGSSEGGGDGSAQGSAAPQASRKRVVRPVKVGRRPEKQKADSAEVQALLVELSALISQAERVMSRLKGESGGKE